MSEQDKLLQADEVIKQVKWDAAGLVPAVVQDAQSKEVLMLAYMNEESLRLSLQTGATWFWSRSREELWNKGATSGHTQRIVSLQYDCDGDTLLVKVNQQGPACHTGKYTCFFNDAQVEGQAATEMSAKAQSAGEQSADAAVSSYSVADRFEVLGRLEETVARRDAERPEGTYTAYLFEKGLDKILKKIGEEATEVVIAAKNDDNDELRSEVSDLIFHLLVLLRQRRLPLDRILQELDRRYGKPTTNKMRGSNTDAN